MRIALFQFGFTETSEVAERVEKIGAELRRLKEVDFVILPELWGQGAFNFANWGGAGETLDGPVVAALGEAATAAGVYLHCGSVLEASADRSQLWNTSVVLAPTGQRLASYRKIHLFGFEGGEADLLSAGNALEVTTITSRDLEEELAIGLSICYDLRFPELYRSLVRSGAQALIVPAAWPLARVGDWELLGRARAVENQAFVLQCNDGGSHGGVEFGGGSQVIGPDGTVLGRLGRGEGVLTVDLDIGSLHERRASFPVLRDQRLGLDQPTLAESVR